MTKLTKAQAEALRIYADGKAHRDDVLPHADWMWLYRAHLIDVAGIRTERITPAGRAALAAYDEVVK